MTSAGSTRPFTGTPSQVVVEQFAALGVRYVFNNTGSHEAAFFDALYGRAGIHGILGLHEGVVTSMAGGYAQVGPRPAVMLAHLDAGLGQSLGQMLNVWNAKLPVVTLTYAADTGSAVDKRGWGHHIRPQLWPHLPVGALRKGELGGYRPGRSGARGVPRGAHRHDAAHRTGAPGDL